MSPRHPRNCVAGARQALAGANGSQGCGRQGPGLADLAAFVERVGRRLPESQRDELVAARRRVWLRNRLPEAVSTAALRDVADHCELATITALATLGAEPGQGRER